MKIFWKASQNSHSNFYFTSNGLFVVDLAYHVFLFSFVIFITVVYFSQVVLTYNSQRKNDGVQWQSLL